MTQRNLESQDLNQNQITFVTGAHDPVCQKL